MKKIKVVRVVTSSDIIPWHMANMLSRMPTDFEVCVVGENVTKYQALYPTIKFMDMCIKRKINLITDLSSLFKLFLFFRSYEPDIVHSVMHKAALLTCLAGFAARVPVRMNTFTSQYWATKVGVPRIIFFWSDWIVNRLNTFNLTDSKTQSDFLSQYGIRQRNGTPLSVLKRGSLSGVELKRFDVESVKIPVQALLTSLSLDRNQHFIFAFLARKTRNKGAFDILNAFSRVKKTHQNARLLFVGPDESDGELEELRHHEPHLFDKVIEIDHSIDDPEVYLGATDVLCLPSYMEGFGSIVIEASAMGVPTIGSRIPGLIDSIDDGKTGILFSVGDVEELANIMKDFIVNTGRYDYMRDAGKERVRKYFSADLIYESLRDCYFLQHFSKA